MTLLGLGLRWHNLDRHGLWADEIYTLMIATDRWDTFGGPLGNSAEARIEVARVRPAFDRVAFDPPAV